MLWRWLALIGKSKKYDLLYSHSGGLGITSTVRLHAARLCDLQDEEFLIELELNKLVNDARFTQYRKVFNRFGFGS